MITEDYVSFETAKLLKKKRFPQSTFRCHYIIDGNNHYKSFENRCGFGDYDIIAPTLTMVMKWLREEHNLHVDSSIYTDTDGDSEHEYTYTYWDWLIFNSESGRRIAEPQIGCGRYDSYEQACEAAIKYCLENLI